MADSGGRPSTISLIARFWAREPVRFLVVGGWNFVFGLAAFSVPYHFLCGCWPDWLIAVLAAVLGITMSFLTHRYLTFRSRGCWWREYLRFYVVYGTQSLLTIALIWLFVTRLGMNGHIVNFVICLVLTVVSYFAHKFYSFRKAERQSI